MRSEKRTARVAAVTCKSADARPGAADEALEPRGRWSGIASLGSPASRSWASPAAPGVEELIVRVADCRGWVLSPRRGW